MKITSTLFFGLAHSSLAATTCVKDDCSNAALGENNVGGVLAIAACSDVLLGAATTVPSYATACQDFASYSSACSCKDAILNGVKVTRLPINACFY
jgi:hypothetical protein